MSFTTAGSGGGFNPSGSGGQPFGVDSEVIAQIVREEFGRKGVSDEDAKKACVKRLKLEGKMIAFYGFQGPLANMFSPIDESEQQEVKLRCFALNDSVSPVFQGVFDFYQFFQKYDQPQGTLKSIKFADAMLQLRSAAKSAPKVEAIDEPEVDEFGDDCTAECVPGHHPHQK